MESLTWQLSYYDSRYPRLCLHIGSRFSLLNIFVVCLTYSRNFVGNIRSN
jgi:hypothetical protein